MARRPEEWLYEPVARGLAGAHPGLRVEYQATRGPGARPHLDSSSLGELVDDAAATQAAVCGPPALLDAVRGAWSELGGSAENLLAETFTPPALAAAGERAEGTLDFLRSDRQAVIGTGTLLEQAEAAGLSPEYGCRMGICHTCTCRKATGAVRNLRTGGISAEQDEDIQLCVSVPAGDVALEL